MPAPTIARAAAPQGIDAYVQDSECERKLAQIPVRGVGAALHRNEELLRRIAGPPGVLNEEQILPLQRTSQAEIETKGVNGDVRRRAGPEIVIRELRDY